MQNLAKNRDVYIVKFDKENGIVIEDTQVLEKWMIFFLTKKFTRYIPCKRSSKDPFILQTDQS